LSHTCAPTASDNRGLGSSGVTRATPSSRAAAVAHSAAKDVDDP
jgi:hypothetical protein